MKNPVIQRTLLAAALAAAVPSLALANPAAPMFYGTLHLSVDVQDSDAPGDDTAVNASSNASFIGLRGNLQLQPQLKVIYQVEALVNLVQDTDFRVNRDTFLGATGDWGLVRIGRFDTPTKVLRSRIDLFNNQVGDARNVVHADGLDRRLNNSIHYRTPVWSGVTGNVQLSTNNADASNQPSGNRQDNDVFVYSVSIQHDTDHSYLAFSHDHDRDNREKAYRLAGYYDLGPARLTALYQRTEKTPDAGATGIAAFDTQAWGVGLRYKVAPKVALKTQYYQLLIDNPADDKVSQIAVGADYQYAPTLQFYANYAFTDNDGPIRRTPYNVARTSTTQAGEKPSGFTVGTVFRF
ncbi:porin [Isoalcanivorax beigongshangi]|uniref:Porin n=1 Tax=Isoalcanivorax beigongshangi TaxID=3238810 RepID=A0ABV4AFF1_9GAMM